MFVATVEALLPGRPGWLRRLQNFSDDLQDATAERARESQPIAIEGNIGHASISTAADMDPDRLLLAYNQLWQFVHTIRSDGLALDQKFCDQVKQDWTVSSLLSHLQNVDRSLQVRAGQSLESASTYFAAAASRSDNPS